MPNGDDPATHGEWLGPVQTPGYSNNDPADPDQDPDGVFAVHAALMHTGRVLMFSGYFESQHYMYRSWEFDPTPVIEAFDTADDPATVAQDDAIGRWFLPGFEDTDDGPGISDDPDIDLFCSHHVALEDGRVLVVGGDSEEREDDTASHDNRGLHIYDPRVHVWEDVPHRMAAGRWYPTAVMMPDGRVAIFSGHTAKGEATDDWPDDEPDLHFFHNHFADVEVVGPLRFDPEIVTGGDRGLYMYPGLVLVKGGRVYSVPTTWNDETDPDPLEAQHFQLTGEASGTWTRLDSGERHPSDPNRQEGTFVLLPPASAGRIMVVGGYDQDAEEALRSCEILETRPPGGEEWIEAGEMHHERVNVSAILLPDGKVLIVGGHDSDPQVNTTGTAQPTPEIYDPSVDFDPADPSAAFTEVADMSLSRMYHSTVLLLPDGHVITAGGFDNDGHGGHGGGAGDQQEMEFYKPPYLFIDGERPEILGVSGQGPHDDESRYGGRLTIDHATPAGDEIETVALIRPGSTTHHTDTEQRYEDLDFIELDGRIVADVPADPSVLPPGYYMLWLVDRAGRPCERAEFVRLSQRSCTIVTDRSHFSAQAYDAEAVAPGDTVEFRHSLYLILHGFAPEELGIYTTDPTAAEAPDVSVLEDGSVVSDVTADLETPGMYLEDPDDRLDVRQRITFEYKISVHDAGAFPTSDGMERAERALDVRTNVEDFTCDGRITLVDSPNPYMLDGDPHWLSTDVRVFQVRDAGEIGGVELTPSKSRSEFLEEFLDVCRAAPHGPGNPFSTLPTEAENARLELAPEVDGDRVLNFAVARVRLQAPTDVTAGDVHVFFRLFVTEQPTLPYNAQAYPKSDGSPAYAQVGQTADEVLTIPFYATERDDVDSSPFDDPNIQDIEGRGADPAVHYFGAWLDINEPSEEPLTDPSTGESRSVQELIRGRHQCMVGEVFFESDEIPLDATPANHDNLSQRNLAIVNSDNPGGPDAHTVLHTFNVQPDWVKLRFQQDVPLDAARMMVSPGQLKRTPVEARPDELAIFWGDMPRDAIATLYFPALDADEIVELARLEGRAGVLKRVAPHTVECPVADVSYVPLPAPEPGNLAGLITVRMPGHVTRGERYRVVVHHISRMKGRIEGRFELLIPVDEPGDFRSEAVRTLAIFRHIAQTLPGDSRWQPIFDRYLEGLEARVLGTGVDPSRVGPSPTGDAPGAAPSTPDRLGDLIACLLDRGGLDDWLEEHDVDPDDLRACLKHGGDRDRHRKPRGRKPLGTTTCTGQRCPEDGLWKMVGGDKTTRVAKGEILPSYENEAVVWKLVEHA